MAPRYYKIFPAWVVTFLALEVAKLQAYYTTKTFNLYIYYTRVYSNIIIF